MECMICGKELQFIGKHLKKHNISISEYKLKFPNSVTCDSDVKQRRINTCIEKYGVSNPGARPEQKKLLHNLHKKGKMHTFNSLQFREKMKELYGSENIAKTEYFKEKSVETFMNNYGVSNPSKSPEIINKIRRIHKEKYGEDNMFKTVYFKELMTKQREEKYGIPNTTSPMHIPEIAEKVFNHRGMTTPEKWLEEYIQTLNCEYIYNFPILAGTTVKYYDFYLPKFNLLIEYDGDFFHSLPKNIINDKYKNTLAYNNGYRLVRIKGIDNLHFYWDIII